MRKYFLILLIMLSGLIGKGQIAAWDFFGNAGSEATFAATTWDANLSSSSNIIRGTDANGSAGINSFRTLGFKNDGIATTNTDYYQISIGAAATYKVSLSTIDAKFAGTGTFYAAPGVTSQFAYSLDNVTYTLIGSPVASGTTIYIRYYASGQTATGGWGFSSSSAPVNGLAIGGSVTPGGGCSATVMSLNTIYTGTLLSTGGSWSTYTSCGWSEAGAEAVYSFTPTSTGSYILDGTQTSGDPDFYLMSTCNCNGTNFYGGCWDNGDITLTLTNGITYYFIVDNYSGSSSAQYSINIKAAGAPVGNESCAGATNITPLPTSGSPYSTSGNLGNSDDCVGIPYFDVFYHIKPICTGDYTFDMGGSNGDTYMNIYQTTCCSGTLVGSDDDSYGGLDPLITLTLTANTDYYIECGSYSSSGMAGSAYNLHVSTTCSGGGCVTPLTQANMTAFSNNTTGTQLTANWTRGSGDDVLIVARLTSVAEITPINGTTYTTNTVFGTGTGSQITGVGNYVVYNGTGTSVIVTGLTAGTSYTFTAYEYVSATHCYALPGAASAVTSYKNYGAEVIPHMTGALIDGCDCVAPTGEGYNEILFFNTGTHALLVNNVTSNFNIWYGSSPATLSDYTCSFTTNTSYITTLNAKTAGTCGNLFIDGYNTVIPAGAVVFVMYSNPCQQYDFSGFCGSKPIYVLFSNCPKWITNGNFANHYTGTGTRYFETKITYYNVGTSGASTTSDIYTSYIQANLPMYSGNYDGGSVSFADDGGVALNYFNDGCTPPVQVLPVELLYFNGNCKNNKIYLTWSTASETNNDYFTIERSIDSETWNNITQTKGSGNSNTQLYYNYSDDAIEGYYRLKQTDLNGQSKLYNPIYVKCDNKYKYANFYPNPTDGTLNIDTRNIDCKFANIKLIGILGQCVKNFDIKITDKNIIDVSDLKGIYYITFECNDFIITKKIIIQ